MEPDVKDRRPIEDRLHDLIDLVMEKHGKKRESPKDNVG
jgi:hypothetical protein